MIYTAMIKWSERKITQRNKVSFHTHSKTIHGIKASGIEQAKEIALAYTPNSCDPEISCLWYDYPQIIQAT